MIYWVLFCKWQRNLYPPSTLSQSTWGSRRWRWGTPSSCPSSTRLKRQPTGWSKCRCSSKRSREELWWWKPGKKIVVFKRFHDIGCLETVFFHEKNWLNISCIKLVRVPLLGTGLKSESDKLTITLTPRRWGSVGRASIKGPSVVQSYWRGFESRHSKR